MNLKNKFASDGLSQSKRIGIIRIEYNLHQAFAITEINEDHPAMVTATMHPPTEVNLLIQVMFRDFSAAVTSHGSLSVR
jgi:hypothetical protein